MRDVLFHHQKNGALIATFVNPFEKGRLHRICGEKKKDTQLVLNEIGRTVKTISRDWVDSQVKSIFNTRK